MTLNSANAERKDESIFLYSHNRASQNHWFINILSEVTGIVVEQELNAFLSFPFHREVVCSSIIFRHKSDHDCIAICSGKLHP